MGEDTRANIIHSFTSGFRQSPPSDGNSMHEACRSLPYNYCIIILIIIIIIYIIIYILYIFFCLDAAAKCPGVLSSALSRTALSHRSMRIRKCLRTPFVSDRIE